MQWLKLPAWKVEDRGFEPHSDLQVSKKGKDIVGSLRDQEVECSASDFQGLNFKSCVCRAVSSHSSHHPQELLLAQFSLYVYKGGLKPNSFHFILTTIYGTNQLIVLTSCYPSKCYIVGFKLLPTFKFRSREQQL